MKRSNRAQIPTMWLDEQLRESGSVRSRTIAIQIFVHLYHRLKKSGRSQKGNRDDIRLAVKELPLHQKRTIRSMATALEIPKLSLFRMKQNKENTVIIPKAVAVKPLLSEMHQVQRVMFAM